MKEEKKYFSSLVEIEIALLITSAVFSFFIEVILHTSIVNCREGMFSFTETKNIYFRKFRRQNQTVNKSAVKDLVQLERIRTNAHVVQTKLKSVLHTYTDGHTYEQIVNQTDRQTNRQTDS